MPQQHQTGQFDRERLLSRIDSLSRRVAELESELDRTHRLATIGTMASSIAHEFNNILTPVMSYAQLALQAPQDAPLVERALTKAVEGTEHASEIAAAMLGFVRDEHQENSADVAAVVKDCVACMAREPAKDGIDLIIDVQPGCRVEMRPIALQQIILNLLLNARAAVKPKVGRLEIRANCSTWNNLESDRRSAVGGQEKTDFQLPASGFWTEESGQRSAVGGQQEQTGFQLPASGFQHEQGNGIGGGGADRDGNELDGRVFVTIEVRDNGCGISAELLPRIFEPFVTSLNGGVDCAVRNAGCGEREDGAMGRGRVGGECGDPNNGNARANHARKGMTRGGDDGGGDMVGRGDDARGDTVIGGAMGDRGRAGGVGPGERKGTGLGLAICHRLVTMAGGTIEVDSRVGEGTSFTVRLPGSGGAAGGAGAGGTSRQNRAA